MNSTIKSAFLRLVAVFALFCVLSPAAHAKTTAEDGKRLETVFSGMIGQYKDAAKARGGELLADGAVMVERSDKYYAVTLPALSFRGANGSRTDIGMIAVNAVPTKQPDVWNMTIALPSPITAYDPAGKAVITASMAGQNFFGVFHEKYKNFTKINAQYRDILILNTPDRVSIKIPDLKILYDLADNGKGLWSGPAKFLISNLSMDFEDGATARINKVAMGSEIKDYDLNAVLQYQEKIDALSESYRANGQATISGTHMMGLYNLVFGFIGTAWDGFTFDVAVDGFAIDTPAIPGSPPGKFYLDRMFSGITMQGFRANDVSLGLKTDYSGLVFEPLAEGDRALLPTHGTLDISINKLPYKNMVDMGAGSLQTAMQTPAMGHLIGLQALAMMPKLMTDAGTNMTVRGTGVGNANYKATIDGVMKADINAAKTYVGNMKATVTGLEYVLAQANAQLKNPETKPEIREKLTQTITMLTVLQMAGQQNTGKDGQLTHTYDLQIDKAGKTLLNGADMSALFPTQAP